MKLYANLHNHTTHSDGVYSPREIVEVAKKEGYGALAVTDHDTVTACREVMAECERVGLEWIFGAEFSSPCKSLGTNFHILGFHFDPEHPEMKSYLEQCSCCEAHQTRVLFERGVDEGKITGIEWQEVLEYNRGITWICNEHVFRAMKAKGLKTDTDYPEFFAGVYGRRRSQVPPLYEFLSAEKIIALIHRSGGIAIVAHPHNQLRFADELVKMGIDGLEVWHHMLGDDERNEALCVALKYDMLVSGGADHAGLCGGQYARYEHPEETEYYFDPCTLGTTKAFFDEIKSGVRMQGRANVIGDMIKNKD